jgi:hypothetical protein
MVHGNRNRPVAWVERVRPAGVQREFTDIGDRRHFGIGGKVPNDGLHRPYMESELVRIRITQ